MTVSAFYVAKAMAAHAHDLGLVFYGATYDDPTRPLVTFGDLPENPVSAVSFNVYDVGTEHDDNLDVDNPLVFIQCRFREAGDDGGQAVHDRAHAFFEGMHSQTPGTWPGGVAPLWCLRTITAPAELDNGHWSKADSYEIRYNPGG